MRSLKVLIITLILWVGFISYMMRKGGFLNFVDCQPGTIDYCGWTMKFFLTSVLPRAAIVFTCILVLVSIVYLGWEMIRRKKFIWIIVPVVTSMMFWWGLPPFSFWEGARSKMAQGYLEGSLRNQKKNIALSDVYFSRGWIDSVVRIRLRYQDEEIPNEVILNLGLFSNSENDFLAWKIQQGLVWRWWWPRSFDQRYRFFGSSEKGWFLWDDDSQKNLYIMHFRR